MRKVRLEVRLRTVEVLTAFERINDFAAYPRLCDVVRRVTVHPATADGAEHSDWEVYFRNGILRWSEIDQPDRELMVIGFAQTEGDFAHFVGSWTLTPEADGSSVVFETEFDFGIPSLAGILDPIAERVFKETIARVLTGLFDQIDVVGDQAVRDALARGFERVAVSGAA
jgi:ribosome-associated toxin RatA of RatAB toxin-antitoxin module